MFKLFQDVAWACNMQGAGCPRCCTADSAAVLNIIHFPFASCRRHPSGGCHGHVLGPTARCCNPSRLQEGSCVPARNNTPSPYKRSEYILSCKCLFNSGLRDLARCTSFGAHGAARQFIHTFLSGLAGRSGRAGDSACSSVLQPQWTGLHSWSGQRTATSRFTG